MPLQQFLTNPLAEINDSLTATINNLFFSVNQLTYSAKVKEVASGKTVFQDATLLNNSLFPLQPGQSALKKAKLTTAAGLSNAKSLVLEYQFRANTQDNVLDPALNPAGLDLTRNDSISHFVELADYYAYDDGTSEAGADIDQRFGKVAIQFGVSKPDTLGAVRFNFSSIFKSVSDQYFLLQIYDNGGGKPGKMLLQQSFPVAPGVGVNGFHQYNLKQSIAVKDTFYVGWTKISESVVAVGLDKNTKQFANKIYYSLGNDWIKNVSKLNAVPDTALKGSLMVRAVMGNLQKVDTTVTAIEEETTEKLIAFPNPTTGVLHWNLTTIKQVNVYDVLGKEILRKSLLLVDTNNEDNRQITLENLVTGLYFVNFSDGKKSYLRKIAVIK